MRRFRNNCYCYLQTFPRFLRILCLLRKCKNFVCRLDSLTCILLYFILFYSFIISITRGPLHKDSCTRLSFLWLLTLVFLWHPSPGLHSGRQLLSSIQPESLLRPESSVFASAGAFSLFASAQAPLL